ncbi:MAG: Gfo/Idh/MocA family oxidoreductase [Paenibacillaceae bacterium]|nr:Gfo/Idh/MocA family oxidoreductase [Paenibacillaceae bacterium]
MEKLKVGIIGLGDWGRCHLEAYRSLPQVEVVAVCDRNEARLAELAELHGVEGRYTDGDELLARDDIALVSVVTFEKDHLQPVLAALRAGKNVLVEKPVSTRLEEAREMQAAAETNGRQLFPGHLLRFDPRYAAVKRQLADGSGGIGRPVSMYLKRSRTKTLFETYRRTHTVFELSVHDLDLAIWYAGARVKAVKAYDSYVTNDQSPDVLLSCLEFDNGVKAVLNSNWMVPQEAGLPIADSLEVIGEAGIASFDNAHGGLQLAVGGGRLNPDFTIHAVVDGRVSGMLREQLDYLTGCLLAGRPADRVSFADAVHGIEVAQAIVESCRTGAEIRL